MKIQKYTHLLIVILVIIICASCQSRLKSRPTTYDLALLSSHVYTPGEKDILPDGFVCENYSEQSLGFFAASYGNKFYNVIVFRGTDNFFDGVADLGLALVSVLGDKRDIKALNILTDVSSELLNAKVLAAINYYETLKKDDLRTFILSGHSLGGFFAQVVGYVSGEETHTFNAPGAKKYIDYRKLKAADQINIINHLSVDVVSGFGEHVGVDTLYSNYGHSIDGFCEFLEKAEKK